MLASSSVRVGGFDVPLPLAAETQPQSHATMTLLQVDAGMARQQQQAYRAWALSNGLSVVSETDTVTGWSLVLNRGAEVLIFTCFYEPRATLCIQVDAD